MLDNASPRVNFTCSTIYSHITANYCSRSLYSPCTCPSTCQNCSAQLPLKPHFCVCFRMFRSPGDRYSWASCELQDGNDPHTFTFGQLCPGSSSCAGFYPIGCGNRVTSEWGTGAIPDPRTADTGLGGTTFMFLEHSLAFGAFWKHLFSSEHRPGSLSNHLCTYLQWPKRNKVAGDDLKAWLYPQVL